MYVELMVRYFLRYNAPNAWGSNGDCGFLKILGGRSVWSGSKQQNIATRDPTCTHLPLKGWSGLHLLVQAPP